MIRHFSIFDYMNPALPYTLNSLIKNACRLCALEAHGDTSTRDTTGAEKNHLKGFVLGFRVRVQGYRIYGETQREIDM